MGALLAAVLGLAAAPAAGQDALGSIRGLVVDSLVAGGPLPGATVEILELGRRTITDGRGVFRFDSVPGGRYMVFFTHPDLDAIGFQPREAAVALGAGIDVTITLATPSAPAIYGALCRGPREENTGVLLGRVTEPVTGRPLEAAEVRGEWEETVLGSSGFERRNRLARAATEPSGRYQLCGVPTDVPVLLTVRLAEAVGAPLELRMGERIVTVRHLSLQVDDAAPRTARVAGTVRSTEGRPVPQALLAILGLADTARSDSAGRFELDGLPAGSHTLDVRAIGFERERVTIELRPGQVTTADVALAAGVFQLPEVTVAAEPGLADPTGFDARMRGGAGRYISRDDIVRRGTIRTEDLFKAIPGLRVEPIGSSGYRILSSRGGTGFDAVCEPTFYLDRFRLPPSVASSSGTDLPIDPTEIHGIEIYLSPADAPLEFRVGSVMGTPTCAIVLIWTRRGGRR